MTVRDYSTTPANNNAAPPNGWPEGQAANTVNDCARQMMAEVRETFEESPYFDFGDDPTRIDNTNFSVATDLTARYPVGSRLKLVGATTGFGRVTVSAFTSVTTITVVMDSGNVPTSLVRVAVQPASGSSETPTGVSLTATAAGSSVGLSRADHIHALSQAIAPTWTQVHTFTGGNTTFSNSTPVLRLIQSGAAADNAQWQHIVSSEQYIFRTINDALSVAANIMTVDRTGTTVDKVAFPADTAAGKVSIGTVTGSVPGSGLLISQTSANIAAATFINAGGASSFDIWNQATSGDNVLVSFHTESSSPSFRGSITYNRGGGVVAYNTTSDARLKTNITQSGSALELVMSIPVEAFDWIETGHHVEHGYVAQHLHPHFPDAVSTGDVWQVDRASLVPLLHRALQEVNEDLQRHKRRVAKALEALLAD